MSVWNFEAATITAADDLASRPIYRTPDIAEFLQFEKSQKRVISGLKGTGKTLFLKLISHHHRRLGGFSLVPKNELTERLYSIDYDFSGDKARAWASTERWKHVWRTVLAVVSLKAIDTRLHDNLLALFPESLGLSIGAHVSAAVRSRSVGDSRFQELFADHLDAQIQSINLPIAVFVDNIDEALARHSGFDLYRDSVERQTQVGSHSYDLWLSAQIGFMLAIRELTARNSHLKIFGTVRSEAIRDNATATAFNMHASVLDLRYTPAELKGIFSTKLRELRKIAPSLFARPREQDHIKAFFPIDVVPHPTVTGVDGLALTEDVFEYMRRHTRGRPRELDFLGHELQLLPPADRTAKMLRDTVRDLSNQFFQFARNEAVPFWDPRLDKLLESAPSNFLTRKQATSMAARLKVDFKTADELWRALHMNGLCGAVIAKHPEGMEQRFAHHDGIAAPTTPDFAAARTWVLHPCANIATRPRRQRYRPNPHNVAGHGYEFATAPRGRRRHVHVVLGAGRLALGLVVPKMLADTSTRVVAVVKRSTKWAVLANDTSEKKTLTVRQHAPLGVHAPGLRIAFRVIDDQSEGWENGLTQVLRRTRCVVFLASEDDAVRRLVGTADSIGCCVGSDAMEWVTELVRSTRPRRARALVAYENDEQAVERMTVALQRSGVTVVPTVVDRICVERDIREDGIVVIAETAGTITALAEPQTLKVMPPAFNTGDDVGVVSVESAEEFNYRRERKKRLVNALHAAAAALVQKLLLELGARVETGTEKLLGVLADNMDVRAQLLGVKDVLILAVIGTLSESRLQASNVAVLVRDLNAYADAAARRMLDGPDAPSRVLRIEPRSLMRKYRRLFADVGDLATAALRGSNVAAVLPIDERDINSRLSALKDAFLWLVDAEGVRGG